MTKMVDDLLQTIRAMSEGGADDATIAADVLLIIAGSLTEDHGDDVWNLMLENYMRAEPSE